MAIWNAEANLILVEATKIADANERSLFVKERCAGDEELHRLVLDLLASEEAISGFLEEPAITNDFVPQPDSRDDLIGTDIGGYKILEQLGEGGFGTVYMAQQRTPVRRKVALKVIKPGMDTREVITRFEAERQALAMMNHPNIARVFDAGTTSTGHPFFVMEACPGRSDYGLLRYQHHGSRRATRTGRKRLPRNSTRSPAWHYSSRHQTIQRLGVDARW